MNEAETYQHALLQGAREMGLAVSEQLASQLAKHFMLVRKWAQKINLTTVLDPERAASIHGLDCLLFAELFSPEEDSQVADVGSGGGFPGIVLALARPQLRLTLLEPQRKRASFLKVALADLGRNDVRVEERRLDVTTALRTDALVSRATIPPLDLARIAAAFLNEGGRLILTSGAGAPSPQDLEAASQGSLQFMERREWTLPAGERRVLDVLTRISA